MREAVSQFGCSGAFRHTLNLLKEVVGQGESGDGCPGLELAVEGVRDVAKLDHF
jgi:hypothetical protein